MDERNRLFSFENALIEARNRQTDIALKEVDDASTSRQHKRNIKLILANNKKIFRNRKSILIAIVAAILITLCGCAIYIYKDEIAKFIRETNADHANMSYEHTETLPTTIVTKHEPTFIPQGYKAIGQTDTLINFTKEWKNESSTIRFSQDVLKGYTYGVDIERGNIQEIIIGDIEVLYCQYNGLYIYLWNDGCYAYELNFNVELPREEIIKIIESVVEE